MAAAHTEDHVPDGVWEAIFAVQQTQIAFSRDLARQGTQLSDLKMELDNQAERMDEGFRTINETLELMKQQRVEEDRKQAMDNSKIQESITKLEKAVTQNTSSIGHKIDGQREMLTAMLAIFQTMRKAIRPGVGAVFLAVLTTSLANIGSVVGNFTFVVLFAIAIAIAGYYALDQVSLYQVARLKKRKDADGPPPLAP